MLIMCPETRAALAACRQIRARPAIAARAEPDGARSPEPDTDNGARELESRLLQRSLELTRLSLHLADTTEEVACLKSQLETVTSACEDALLMVDASGEIRSINLAAERMFGIRDFTGKPLTILVAPADADRLRQLLEEVMRAHEQQPAIEFRGRHNDGRNFPAQLSLHKVDGQELFACMVRDLSERQLLQREVLEVAEREKRAIGQELHDSIGQQLTGLRFYAEMLAQSLTSKLLPEAEQANKLRAVLEEVGLQVREMSHGLMPPIVDGSGLPRALARLATDVDYLDHFHCEFVCYEPAISAALSAGTATQLYRIAQEATQNAIRHSGGDRIRISFETADDELCLQIVDNGTGIDKDNTRGASGGIRIMQHRAALIGAILRIRNGESGGTDVQCRLAKDMKGSA
jgi:two-component system, LuxR family, sensor kinase FixL